MYAYLHVHTQWPSSDFRSHVIGGLPLRTLVGFSAISSRNRKIGKAESYDARVSERKRGREGGEGD